MRLRILTGPTGDIDGISLERFVVGEIYDLGAHLGCVFLAEGWGEIVSDDGTPVFASPPEISNVAPIVLVVDDDPGVRRLTESLLLEHGYRVVLAAHGRDGIRQLLAHCPDLIVLDLNMPVMDGWDFRAEQRYLTDPTRATAPVLVMSGEENAETLANRLEAVGMIRKPFNPDDLLEAISAAIGSQRSAPDGIRSVRPRTRQSEPHRAATSTTRADRTPS
jgi:CheY-like chemotaxis protein